MDRGVKVLTLMGGGGRVGNSLVLWAPVGITETFNEVLAEGKVDEGLHGSW